MKNCNCGIVGCACSLTTIDGGPSITKEICSVCGQKWERYSAGSYDYAYQDCFSCSIKAIPVEVNTSLQQECGPLQVQLIKERDQLRERVEKLRKALRDNCQCQLGSVSQSDKWGDVKLGVIQQCEGCKTLDVDEKEGRK